jgi:signal transduction histidine kinase
MVTRSLVVRIYLYAVVALIALGGLVVLGVHQVFNQGVREGVGHFKVAMADLAADELAASTRGGVPAPGRLQSLSSSLHVRLLVVPWKEVGRYPAALRWSKVTPMNGRASDHVVWARMDGVNGPIGALRVEFHPPHLIRRPPVVVALGLVVLMGVILVPPLLVWVVAPLRRMGAVAHRLGAGDFATPVPVTRRDEFGELEGAFEAMRIRIQQMLEQKDRLLIDISHELRGPLARMSIALPLAAGPAPNSYHAQIARNVQEMDHLIGELLALARGQLAPTLAKKPLDLAAIARELLAERQLTLDQRSQACQVDLEPASTEGDESLLRRAMGNLLDNAIKYTPERGRIAVATRVDGDEAVFRVADNGPGIPAAALPHVFEPFFRPDTSRTRETGGTGLGLSIVRAIAEQHGGKAALESEEGTGTTAELRVPAIG